MRHQLKVIIMLICLSSVNWQVLKIPSTLSDKLKSIHGETRPKMDRHIYQITTKNAKTHEKLKVVFDNVRSETLQTVNSVVIMTLIS